MKIHVNIINSKIQTDNPKILEALYELYSFKIPGSEYSLAYKRRNWDGRQHFLSRSGVFKTGLLKRVVEDLNKIDCTPQVIYLANFPANTPNNWQIQGFKYYDYQEELILKGINGKRGMIKSPTGSGKTLIMAGLVKALAGQKMVILFNAKQLLKQTYDFFTKDCRLDNIGICFGEGYIDGDIMLCTVQSIERILDTHLKEAKVLMVDECHEFANGKTTLAAIN